MLHFTRHLVCPASSSMGSIHKICTPVWLLPGTWSLRLPSSLTRDMCTWWLPCCGRTLGNWQCGARAQWGHEHSDLMAVWQLCIQGGWLARAGKVG